MAVRTLRQVSTPSSSSGKWSGKSMREKRVWSGRANSSGGCNSLGSTGTWNTQIIEYMGLVATKPVFGISDKARLKLVSLATETSWKIEILLKASWDMILSSEQITKALVSLRGWAGWSAPLLFANPKRQVLPWRGPYGCSENSWSTNVVCWWPLQKVWTQIRPDKMSSWSGSKLFDTLMVFLKEFLKKLTLKKNKDGKKACKINPIDKVFTEKTSLYCLMIVAISIMNLWVKIYGTVCYGSKTGGAIERKLIYTINILKETATPMFTMKDLNKPWILIPVSYKLVELRGSYGHLNICNWTVMEEAIL